MPRMTYLASGVDLDAAAQVKDLIKPLVRSTFGPQVLGDVGLFGGLFQLQNFREPVLVSSTDGVGTKLKLAVWLDQYQNIGKDVVNQSINDVLTSGARPLFFLDYIAMESLLPERLEALVRGMAEACREAGCALLGGETSQMSGVFKSDAFELVGFVVGAAEREALLDPSNIKAGDLLIGLPSSGLHTNGYSLVRAIFNLEEDRSPLYEAYDELGCTLGEALLEPHRGYWPLLEPVLPLIKAMAHITGSGMEDNLERVMPPGLTARVDWSSWETPPVFRIIQAAGNVDLAEMRRVFNMGVGMVLVCAAEHASDIVEALPEAWVVGEATGG